MMMSTLPKIVYRQLSHLAGFGLGLEIVEIGWTNLPAPGRHYHHQLNKFPVRFATLNTGVDFTLGILNVGESLYW